MSWNFALILCFLGEGSCKAGTSALCFRIENKRELVQGKESKYRLGHICEGICEQQG